jgi:hypothetical protein
MSHGYKSTYVIVRKFYQEQEVMPARLHCWHLTHGFLLHGEPASACTGSHVPLTIFHASCVRHIARSLGVAVAVSQMFRHS